MAPVASRSGIGLAPQQKRSGSSASEAAQRSSGAGASHLSADTKYHRLGNASRRSVASAGGACAQIKAQIIIGISGVASGTAAPQWHRSRGRIGIHHHVAWQKSAKRRRGSGGAKLAALAASGGRRLAKIVASK